MLRLWHSRSYSDFNPWTSVAIPTPASFISPQLYATRRDAVPLAQPNSGGVPRAHILSREIFLPGPATFPSRPGRIPTWPGQIPTCPGRIPYLARPNPYLPQRNPQLPQPNPPPGAAKSAFASVNCPTWLSHSALPVPAVCPTRPSSISGLSPTRYLPYPSLASRFANYSLVLLIQPLAYLSGTLSLSGPLPIVH